MRQQPQIELIFALTRLQNNYSRKTFDDFYLVKTNDYDNRVLTFCSKSELNFAFA